MCSINARRFGSLVVLVALMVASGRAFAVADNTLQVTITCTIIQTNAISFNVVPTAGTDVDGGRTWAIGTSATLNTAYVSSTDGAITADADGNKVCPSATALDFKNVSQIPVSVVMTVTNNTWTCGLLAAHGANDIYMLKAALNNVNTKSVMDVSGTDYNPSGTGPANWTVLMPAGLSVTLVDPLVAGGVQTLDLEFITPLAVSTGTGNSVVVTLTSTLK